MHPARAAREAADDERSSRGNQRTIQYVVSVRSIGVPRSTIRAGGPPGAPPPVIGRPARSRRQRMPAPSIPATSDAPNTAIFVVPGQGGNEAEVGLVVDRLGEVLGVADRIVHPPLRDQRGADFLVAAAGPEA